MAVQDVREHVETVDDLTEHHIGALAAKHPGRVGHREEILGVGAVGVAGAGHGQQARPVAEPRALVPQPIPRPRIIGAVGVGRTALQDADAGIAAMHQRPVVIPEAGQIHETVDRARRVGRVQQHQHRPPRRVEQRHISPSRIDAQLRRRLERQHPLRRPRLRRTIPLAVILGPIREVHRTDPRPRSAVGARRRAVGDSGEAAGDVGAGADCHRVDHRRRVGGTAQARLRVGHMAVQDVPEHVEAVDDLAEHHIGALTVEHPGRVGHREEVLGVGAVGVAGAGHGQQARPVAEPRALVPQPIPRPRIIGAVGVGRTALQDADAGIAAMHQRPVVIPEAGQIHETVDRARRVGRVQQHQHRPPRRVEQRQISPGRVDAQLRRRLERQHPLRRPRLGRTVPVAVILGRIRVIQRTGPLRHAIIRRRCAVIGESIGRGRLAAIGVGGVGRRGFEASACSRHDEDRNRRPATRSQAIRA